MLIKKRSLLLSFVIVLTSLSSLSAQSQLNRISITERGDGNGIVIRFHLTEMVNSFDVSQPEIDRTQVQLFSSTINTDGVEMPVFNSEITGIALVDIDGGIGVEISAGENVYFSARAYPDQNLRDLLLNLEYTSRPEVEALVSESEPFAWSAQQPEMEAEPEAQTEPEEVPSVEEEEETMPARTQTRKTNIHFGFAGGIGVANKIGGSYTSDPRQKMTMGITASVDLPFMFMNSIESALETGLFYTQKGFENPSGDNIQGQTVVLDYIEIPLMAKLRYGSPEIAKPYAVGGFYTAFRTAAEIVQEEGEREDIGDVTNNIDFGLIAGLGSDFVFDKATVSLQARFSAGLPRMFNEGYSGGERPTYLSLLVGFQF